MDLHLALKGINEVSLKPVSVAPTPDALKPIFEPYSIPQQCYDNSYDFIADYQLDPEPKHSDLVSCDLIYVLGFTASEILMEHAFLKIDGVYYDPTLNQADREYFSVVEFNLHELADYIHQYEQPPMFEYLIHHSGKWSDDVHQGFIQKAMDFLLAANNEIETIDKLTQSQS